MKIKHVGFQQESKKSFYSLKSVLQQCTIVKHNQYFSNDKKSLIS